MLLGGESLADALVRARVAARAILGEAEPVVPDDDAVGRAPAEPVLGYERTFAGGDVPAWAVVVAHDGVLRLLMLDLLGIGLEHFWSFPLALASVSVLDLGAGVVRLRAHNLDEHIVALARTQGIAGRG